MAEQKQESFEKQTFQKKGCQPQVAMRLGAEKTLKMIFRKKSVIYLWIYHPLKLQELVEVVEKPHNLGQLPSSSLLKSQKQLFGWKCFGKFIPLEATSP